MKLWKHHAAQGQADRINALAAERGEPWLPRYGGRISSEWEFAKALQMLEEDPEAFARADRWIEAADWIVWQLCGRETRNTCTAGYKAIYQDGRYPSREYLAALDERFAGFVEDKLEHPLSDLGARAGGADRRGGGMDRAAGGHRGRRRQRRRARHRAGRARDRARADARRDGHVHVPRDERRLARRGARHVRRRAAAGSPRGCGATRRARAASATSSAGSSSNAVPPRYFDEARRARRRRARPPVRARRSPRTSASTAWSRSTGRAGTARCWSTTS